jgi:Fungal specific transcription factor domain/Fungal Zn(2)-Cys(6) binuclear cluster domain
MVGQPRSKGCRICVQRRVKCDLTRPKCLRCQKGNRSCPGYPADIQFLDETAKVRQQFGEPATKSTKDPDEQDVSNSIASNDPLSTSSSSQSSPGNTSLPTPDPSSQTSSDWALAITVARTKVLDSPLGLDWGKDTELPPGYEFVDPNWDFMHQLYSPDSQQRQLFSLFQSSIAPIKTDTPKVFRKHGDWLSQVSALQGNDPLIDTTFRAVSLAHLSLLQREPSLMHESRRLYGKSLGLLNKALCKPDQGRSTETLSATILLSFYEMFSSNHETSNGYDSWIKHAGGAGALMQLRGPKAHRYGLDRSMFLAYRNIIVIQTFEAGKPCFLDEPEWRELAADIHEDVQLAAAPGGVRIEMLDVSEEFMKELVKLPRAVSDAQHITTLIRAAGGNRRAVVDDLVARAKRHCGNLKTLTSQIDDALRRIGQGVIKRASETDDRLFPIRYDFPNIFSAAHYIGYWNVLMLMNIILLNYDPDISARQVYAMENVEAAREICASAEYMAESSFLGPFFITFALRTSLHVLDTNEEKVWVVQKLMEIGKKLGMAKQVDSTERSLPAALRREVEELKRFEEVVG